MDDTTPHRRAGWLKITLLSTAAVVALALVAATITVTLVHRRYGHALTIREQLDARHGTFDGYHPAPDGTIPADRMARFLDVRRALLPRCPGVTDIVQPFRRMPELARTGDPGEVDASALFGGIVRVVRRLPSVGFVFGNYVTTRNNALLAQGMSLGEYSFIYVVSYFAVMGESPRGVLEREGEPSIFESRVFPAVGRAIGRHAADLGGAGGPWADEAARLERDPARVPFAGGLPPELAGSIEPHRAALAAASCPAAAELDLTVTVRRGSVGYDHR